MLTIPVAPTAAFAFLADPRNAAEWFAPVAYTPADTTTSAHGMTPNKPTDPLRVGSVWRFTPTRRGRAIPMRMASYAPPNSFAWETTYSGWRDNLRWGITCEEAQPKAQSEQSEQAEQSATRVTMTIRQNPGPLGWLVLLVSAPFMRFRAGWLVRRANRALERASDTLNAYNEVYTNRTAQRKQRRAQAPRRKR